MLPGVTGTLLARTFLDRLAREQLARHEPAGRGVKSLRGWWRQLEQTLGPASSVRAIADTAALPLLEAHGYRVLQLEPHGSTLVGCVSRGGEPVAVTVASWVSAPDREWRQTVRAGRITGATWGVVFTGRKLRVVDAGRAWSRRAIEFDLPTTLADEHSMAALITVIEAAGAGDRNALAELVARSERHGLEVCTSLGTGVIEALSEIFRELDGTRHAGLATDRATFEQAVTIVYRLLFLLFAEARSLVPTWHQVYRNAYTIDSLCRRALTQPSRRGLWKGLQAISRLAHDGCHAGDLIVTPFNGRLFSPRHTPLAERARLSDRAVGKAIVSLATTSAGHSRERIAYDDLGVEQLGAVYERVLEYEPARQTATTSLARTSLERKTTSSFYTPRSITDFLVRRALHPLVNEKAAEQILQLRIVDPAMGSGAFLVAACRYLSSAVEAALIDEGALSADCTPAERSAIRRTVAQRCLFGVDLNPMAVQLARLSLWLATLSKDRPLTFLDHHLATGDSLVGASFADLARDPMPQRPRDLIRGGTTLPLFDLDPTEALMPHVLPERFRIALEPGDTPAAVRDKERALARLGAAGTPLTRWTDAASLWCAAWHGLEISRGVYRDVLLAITDGAGALAHRDRERLVAQARSLADSHRFFHWELAFPEAFFTATGGRRDAAGFDAVIGNPPWDVLRADTGSRDDRDRVRREQRSSRQFFKDSRVYRHQGHGHANRYQLFIERALQLVRPGGRLALIVPAGLVSDQGSAPLRRALLEDTAIDGLFGFDNRSSIFPIHRDVRFVLLTATKGRSTERLVCRFGLSDPQTLDRLPNAAADDPAHAKAVTLRPGTLKTWDPEHLAIPWLTRAEDLELVSHIHSRVPTLSAADGWSVTFGRELNATDDREDFVSVASSDADSMLPVIGGKHLEPFRVLTTATSLYISPARAAALVDPARTFGRARIAYREVASATNRLTLIAARLAVGTISTHTVFCSRDKLGVDAHYCLLALLNSLVANYLVRLRVTTHVTATVMARLPVPRPASRSSEFTELARLARALEQGGVTRHEDAYARLNALAAHLYGLTPSQYAYVVSTFPLLSPDLRTLAVHVHATETQRTQR